MDVDCGFSINNKAGSSGKGNFDSEKFTSQKPIGFKLSSSTADHSYPPKMKIGNIIYWEGL